MKEILITSSVLIAVLLLLRRVLRGKISLRLQYALWLLVAAVTLWLCLLVFLRLLSTQPSVSQHLGAPLSLTTSTLTRSIS